MAYVPFIAIGFVSILLQITVLRELLTVFSGNELDMGITLSLWLISVGLGSLAGSNVKRQNWFGLSFLVVALLSLPTLLGIDYIRPALGLTLGESASLGGTIISTAVTLFPLCFTLGFQFPLAVRYWRAKGFPEAGRPTPAPVVYGLEAAGAFLGGVLFTFVLSGRVGPMPLVLALVLLYIIFSVSILRKKELLLFVVLPLALSAAASVLDARKPYGGEIIKNVQSRYGEILVTDLEGQMNFYGAGHFLFTYPNPQVDELSVHLPMSASPAAEYVLAVGGSPGRLDDFLKYPIKRVDFVEMDPKLIETSLEVISDGDSALLESKKVRIVTRDGRRFIKLIDSPEYDLVVLNLSEPSTASTNRYYTKEFFVELRGVLRPGGKVALSLPTSAGYVSRRMKLANGSIYNSLRSVFEHVEASTEEYGLFLASDAPVDISPERLVDNFVKSGVSAEYFHPYIIEDAFSPLRVDLHKERLGSVSAVNTDLRPAAYLYNLMLWAEMHGASALNAALELGGYTVLLFFVLFIAIVPGIVRNRKKTLYYSMFTTGYAAMAFTLAVLLGFQSLYGYVYEMFGLLSAVFMVGMAAGSYLMRRIGLRGLVLLEGITAVFAVSSLLFFSAEPMFYLYSLLAGLITGFQFAAVNICMKSEGPARTGGIFYFFDLGGSFLGATLTAIVFIPLLGINESLYIVGGLKVVSAVMVFLVRDE
jgi:spermidine synthase